jgi:hypothetical protein
MTKPMDKKILAVGEVPGYAPPDEAGIDRVLALRKDGSPQRSGWGRVVTTCGTMNEIHERMAEGYEILWCQMTKSAPGKADSHD